MSCPASSAICQHVLTLHIREQTGDETGCRQARLDPGEPGRETTEQEVRQVYGDSALIARPGLIVGPHDTTERFGYWPRRMARGGRVLAPGDPADPMQFIDVRDLAGWLVAATAGGDFNVVAPPLPMADLLEACRTDAPAELVWVPSERLLAAGVDPWMGVPLWLGDPSCAAANLIDASRARAAGLHTRPVAETVADTRAWDVARGGPAPGTDPFPPDKEDALLATLTGQH